MMRTILFITGIMLAIVLMGCRLVPSSRSTTDAFPLLDPSDVACIVIGDDRSEVVLTKTNHNGRTEQVFPFNEFLRITNRQEIAELVTEVNALRDRRDGRLTLSGILSMQAYMSHRGNVLALATIICADSTVLVTQDAETTQTGKVFLLPPSDKAWTSGSQRAYGRKILQIMRARCPAQVQWREKECKEMGQTIEEYMGLVD